MIQKRLVYSAVLGVLGLSLAGYAAFSFVSDLIQVTGCSRSGGEWDYEEGVCVSSPETESEVGIPDSIRFGFGGR